MRFLFFLLSILIELQLQLAKEQLIAKELTDYQFNTTQTDSWSISKVYQCPGKGVVDYGGSYFLGMLGNLTGESVSKTFPNLPPHWSLSVRTDFLLFNKLNSSIDYIQVYLDTTPYGSYSKGPLEGFGICNGRDQLVFFNQNLTTHTTSSINVTLYAIINGSYANEGFAMRNFFLYVDTCDISCLTCDGPTSANCLTCPPNSSQNRNTCSCDPSYYSFDNTCVQNCPAGYVIKNLANYCMVDPCALNCASCDSTNQVCLSCSVGYYLYEGTCVTTCPPSSLLSSKTCVDFSIKLTNPRYLIKNGLSSNTFGESEVKSYNITVTGFKGDKGVADSTALTTQCGQNYHLLGGAFLSGSRSTINLQISNMDPHWSVRIGYVFLKIDSWDDEHAYLTIDSKIVRNTYYGPNLGSQICGSGNNDFPDHINVNITHSAPSLTIKISTNLDEAFQNESFGIRELFILVDYCPEHCSSCNASGCTACLANYVLKDKRCILNSCPSTQFPLNQACYPCDGLCKTCSGSSNTCTSCYSSTYLFSSTCVAICPPSYCASTSSLTCDLCDTSSDPSNPLECSPQCVECQEYPDDCTLCAPGTFLPPKCTYCSPQCEECQGNADDCTVCSTGRITPPQCACNPQFYDLSLSNNSECIPYKCSIQCETCEYTQFSCTSCSLGRRDPPYCSCLFNYYESTLQECLACPSHQYYSSANNSCQPCSSHCSECFESSTHCTQCYANLFLVGSTCLCSDQSNFILSSTSEVICSIIGMDVSLSLVIKNSAYWLVFSFEEDLTLINFDETPIDTILFIYIQQVPSENYWISYAEIVGNQLNVQLIFQHSFSATSGSATFIKTQDIIGSSTQRLLDNSYLTKQLPFKIGPILFSETDWQMNSSLESITNTLKNMDQTGSSFMRQFSIVFYVLNTLQPTVQFIMTTIVIPPNLYQSLSIPALMIFSKIENYQIYSDTVPTHFLRFSLEKDQDISVNSQLVFRRFSLSNCMLVNIPITLAQSFIYYLLFAAFQIYKTFSSSDKHITFAQKGSNFILKTINSNHEKSLLLLSTAIFNQFITTDAHQYFNTNSFYLAIILTVCLLYFRARTYCRLSTVSSGSYDEPDSPVLVELLSKLKFNLNLNLSKFYYFSQLLKKYIVSALIVFSHDYPAVVCAGSATVYFLSAAGTAFFMPYKAKLNNVIKIMGELCLLTVWMIYLLKFIPFQKSILKVTTIQPNEAQVFLQFGTAATIILAVYNGIYFLKFLWEDIIMQVVNLKKKQPNTVIFTKPVRKNQNKLNYLKYNNDYLKQQKLMISHKRKLKQQLQQSQLDLKEKNDTANKKQVIHLVLIDGNTLQHDKQRNYDEQKKK